MVVAVFLVLVFVLVPTLVCFFTVSEDFLFSFSLTLDTFLLGAFFSSVFLDVVFETVFLAVEVEAFLLATFLLLGSFFIVFYFTSFISSFAFFGIFPPW